MATGKEYKGQQQVIPGSYVGEPIITQKIDYNDKCLPEYLGQAKIGMAENAFKWHIQRIVYDADCNPICFETACNILTTKATELSIDVDSNSPLVKISIVGGVFEHSDIGESLEVKTPSNTFKAYIKQKLSDTEILVEPVAPVVNESNTSISDEDLLIIHRSDEKKDYAKRRWDKREYYIYA